MYYYNISLSDFDGDTYNNMIAHERKWSQTEFKKVMLEAVEAISKNVHNNRLDISENIDEIVNYMVETFSFIELDLTTNINLFYDLSLDAVKERLANDS